MDYKTVMVSLALDRPNDACLAVAGDFAERFEARVVGIAASDFRPPLYFADGDYAQKLLDEEAAAILRRLSELEAEFRASVSKRAKSVEWRSARSCRYHTSAARKGSGCHCSRRASGSHCRSLRRRGSERSGHAGRPSAHCRAA